MSGTDDAQHVVDVARHPVELHHLRHAADHLGEAAEPLLRVVAGLDRDEHGDAEPDLGRVDQGDALW